MKSGFSRYLISRATRKAKSLFWIVVACATPAPAQLPPPETRVVDFERDIQPIFAAKCLKCHGNEKQKGGYRLDVKEIALQGGEAHAPNIVPGNSEKSPLIQFVAGRGEIKMPPTGEPLSAAQISILRRWIDDGAAWPEKASTKVNTAADKKEWWSLKPIVKVAPPRAGNPTKNPTSNPIDAFIAARLAEKGLAMAPPADTRTLGRRLYFDLTGLPPTPEELDAFVADKAPDAYERLVDKLLDSPRYGERWARHWLDVVHYGETHGYDKDQPRPNAWPYRDYVIRAFNEDRPYARFVQEQLAGDVLFPNTRDGIEALGFIAAGPWDLIGHAEVPENKIDGKIARHLDRDDMVSNTINTFTSMTAHCAQCHDHKFDPISQEDYYSLQANFAALDRADKTYDDDPTTAARRAALQVQQRIMRQRRDELNKKAQTQAGDALAALDKKITEFKQGAANITAQFGYHAALENRQDALKWVQLDLGRAMEIKHIVLHASSDNFNNIGDGFGFPLRFKVEVSSDEKFQTGVTVIADETAQDFTNPKLRPVAYETNLTARFVRVTATKLMPRMGDFMFALAEMEVLDAGEKNLAFGAEVTAFDSIEMPVRWARANLTDSYYPGVEPGKITANKRDTTRLEQARRLIIEASLTEKEVAELGAAERSVTELNQQINALPRPRVVYAGTVHNGSGAFAGTGASGGKPRPIFLLARGDVKRPGREVQPGAVSGIEALPARFVLPQDAPEGERRAALARWITDKNHPLTWRSIVNRVWQYHFGRGLVETPNDFGHMGALPTHPERLDYLAATFRDDFSGSFKKLHRLMVNSAAYKQSSSVPNPKAAQLDANNTLLWHGHRRKLEAEAVRDSVLFVAGKLDFTMGGPSFKDFVVTHPEHSPHYEYQLNDPENPATHRRAIYRFLARSQQQPWMAALDCADPSLLVDKRNQTITPLQALAQLNNQLMVVMAKHFAARLDKAENMPAKITLAFRLALQRDPTEQELKTLTVYAAQYGLPNTCRVIINLNEFAFVD